TTATAPCSRGTASSWHHAPTSSGARGAGAAPRAAQRSSKPVAPTGPRRDGLPPPAAQLPEALPPAGRFAQTACGRPTTVGRPRRPGSIIPAYGCPRTQRAPRNFLFFFLTTAVAR